MSKSLKLLTFSINSNITVSATYEELNHNVDASIDTSSGTSAATNFKVVCICVNDSDISICVNDFELILYSDNTCAPTALAFTQTGSTLDTNHYYNPGDSYLFTISGTTATQAKVFQLSVSVKDADIHSEDDIGGICFGFTL